VPNFLQFSGVGEQLPLHLCKIKCSNKHMKTMVIGDNQLMCTVQNQEAQTVQKGFVYVFQDDFHSELLGVCCLEVHALTFVSFGVRAGEEYDYTLKVHNRPDDKGETPLRTIELFSSDPDLIYPPNGKKRNVQVLKDIKKFA
jgi:hypothetical protein